MPSLTSTDLHVKSHGSFVTLASLKLHGIPFVEVFNLRSRRKTPAMKKNFITAIIRDDKAITLLANNFFDRSGHVRFLLLGNPLPKDTAKISLSGRNDNSPAVGWVERSDTHQ